MNSNLLQLKNEFGFFSSWALLDKDGRIKAIIEDSKFETLIKPNIFFGAYIINLR
jgi:hypothetical protein